MEHANALMLFGRMKLVEVERLRDGRTRKRTGVMSFGQTLVAAVDESYTIAQWLAHLPGKQKVPCSNPGGAA